MSVRWCVADHNDDDDDKCKEEHAACEKDEVCMKLHKTLEEAMGMDMGGGKDGGNGGGKGG